MQPLRILIFSAFFDPHKGGVERMVKELGSRLVGRGHEVTVLTCALGDAPETESVAGIKVIRIPARLLLSGEYVLPMPGIRTQALVGGALHPLPHIIHTNTRFYVTSYMGRRLATKWGVPHVHTEHGSVHTVLANKLASGISHIVDHTMGTSVIKESSVVAVSRAAAEFAEHLGAKSPQVIPNGVDAEKFSPGPSTWREEFGVSDGEIVVTFMGRLVFGKGVHDLIKSWRDISERYTNCKLVIVGSGTLHDELKKAASHLHGSVIFTGELDSTGVVNVLRASDIFCNPSHSEGLPSTIIEAGAICLPTVSSDIPGAHAVVVDGTNGLFFKPGDVSSLTQALSTLISDPSAREEMGKAARGLVLERFDWDRVVSAYEDLYYSISKAN